MKIGPLICKHPGGVQSREVDAECPGPSILAASQRDGHPYVKLRMGAIDGEQDLTPQECRQLAYALEKAADIAAELAGGE